MLDVKAAAGSPPIYSLALRLVFPLLRYVREGQGGGSFFFPSPRYSGGESRVRGLFSFCFKSSLAAIP